MESKSSHYTCPTVVHLSGVCGEGALAEDRAEADAEEEEELHLGSDHWRPGLTGGWGSE